MSAEIENEPATNEFGEDATGRATRGPTLGCCFFCHFRNEKDLFDLNFAELKHRNSKYSMSRSSGRPLATARMLEL